MDAEYPRSQVGQMRDSVEAIRTVMGWNTVWDQRVKVITPVSRTFGVSRAIVLHCETVAGCIDMLAAYACPAAIAMIQQAYACWMH